MRLQYKNIIYDVTDRVVIERLLSDGFHEVGTKKPENPPKVVDVDKDTGNSIEKTETKEPEREVFDLDKMVKAELMELLDEKRIEYSGSATRATLLKIAKDNKLGDV